MALNGFMLVLWLAVPLPVFMLSCSCNNKYMQFDLYNSMGFFFVDIPIFRIFS